MPLLELCARDDTTTTRPHPPFMTYIPRFRFLGIRCYIMAATATARAYHIGTAGTKWGLKEITQWRSERVKSRSYAEEVIAKLEQLKSAFDVFEYGALLRGRSISHPVRGQNQRVDARQAVRARNGRRARVRDQRRAGRAAVPHGGSRRRVRCQGCEHPGGAVRVTVGLRAHPAVEPRGRGPEPLLPLPRRRGGVRLPGGGEPREASPVLRPGSWRRCNNLHETTDTDETEFRVAKAARDGEESGQDDP